MNHESSSVLQKATFILLLFIAAALSYLIMRDYVRSGKDAAAPAEPASIVPVAAAPSAPPVFPVEMKPSFAPLRPRIETNAPRVPTNRILLARPNLPPPVPADAPSVIVVAPPVATLDGLPVPAAVATGFVNGDQAGAGIAGRVMLRGAPPTEKRVALDALCGRAHPAPMMTRHFVVGADRGLANTFVYIKSGAPLLAATSAGPLLDQVACEYQPYVLGVQAGQTFSVRNSDPFLHNVHAQPKSGPERNVAQPVKGMVTPFVFTNAEVLVRFKCDVHPWMFAYVGVVDHPWFAVTDRNGNFALPAGLPPGQYTLAAVHQKAGEVTQPVTVSGGGIVPVNFTLDVPDTLAKSGTQ